MIRTSAEGFAVWSVGYGGLWCEMEMVARKSNLKIRPSAKIGSSFPIRIPSSNFRSGFWQNGHRILIQRVKTMKNDYLLVIFGIRTLKNGFEGTCYCFRAGRAIQPTSQQSGANPPWLDPWSLIGSTVQDPRLPNNSRVHNPLLSHPKSITMSTLSQTSAQTPSNINHTRRRRMK